MADKIASIISLVVVTMVLIYCTPVIVDAVQGTNTSGWNFTGYAGAKALWGLTPFTWIAGVLIAMVVGVIVIAKTPTSSKKQITLYDLKEFKVKASSYIAKILRKMGRPPYIS